MRLFEGGEGKGIELTSLCLTLSNQRAYRRVRFSKAGAFFYEVIGEVSRHHAAGKSCAHPRCIKPNLLERAGNRRQYEENRVDRVEQNAFVVLEILVVAAR